MQDREAFAALWVKYERFIFGFLYTQTSRNHILAEDLTSATFLKAWQAWGSFVPKSEIQTRVWLKTIARNLAYDYWSRRSTQREHMPDDVQWTTIGNTVATNPDAEDLLVARMDAQALRGKIEGCMAELTESQQQAMYLRYYRQLLVRDVAVAMGKDTDTAKALLQRALRSLTMRMEEHGVIRE